MALTTLERSILKTLVYFDLLEYPLTATETWKYLYRPDKQYSLEEVADSLENSSSLQPYVSRAEGFYHLQGRQHIVPIRKVRNNRVDGQMKKVKRIAKILRLFPSIHMVAIASSLSIGNVKEDSDIDLFIISKENQVWVARFCAAGILKLLGLRPDEKVTKDRFCLTFFISRDQLDVQRGSYTHDDIAYQYYVQSFMPIYDPYNVYSEFLKANAWWKKYIPNGYFEQRLIGEVSCPRAVAILHGFLILVMWPLSDGRMGDWQKKIQLRIMPRKLKALANVDSRVIMSDSMLKFHDKDNRRELYQRWSQQMKTYE